MIVTVKPKIREEKKKMYDEIRKRLLDAQKNMLKPSTGPFPTQQLLEKGEKVWAFLTSEDPVPAVVLKDYGNVVLVE